MRMLDTAVLPNLSLVFLVLLLLGTGPDIFATHNRAGEITYEQIGDLTIRATIVTYTRTSSVAADRDSLTLYWGDGDSTVVLRSNGDGFELPSDIKRNEYVSEHTYPTRGTYTLSMTDPNRIAGILNIDAPNSVNIRFYIETTFTLLEPRFQGRNSSAILLQPPIDFACAGEIYTYNPNAYDVDGDSLSYELITPFASQGREVPNYELPDQIAPGPDNMIALNKETGDFTWNAPQFMGEYNITYRINEHRSGVLINSIVRDMQILVRGCSDENNRPIIESVDEICVIAGENITLDLIGSDIDTNEILTITASGGPFELLSSPAELETEEPTDNSMISGVINWQTTCDHISREYYQIVVRVTDELSRPSSALATLKTIRIKVVAPPPLNPLASNNNGIVNISWQDPYACSGGSLFQGFSVWRKLSSATVPIDTCLGGLEGTGYERIIFLTNESEGGRYIAQDAEIDPNNIYCYRIVAEFAELTDLGNPYNTTQSLPSEEICIRSTGDEPLITNVSIRSTDVNTGSLFVKWINPTSEAIDTTILTGPYSLELLGTANINGVNLQPLSTFNYNMGEFATIQDTLFEIDQINTAENGHSYQLNFSSGNNQSFFTSSDIASSVFLSAIGTDRQINLAWDENVPWNNFNYYIYEIQDGIHTLIDSTNESLISIEDLQNGQEYCYKVMALGTYNIDGIPDPLINESNEDCAVARDDAPPCPPQLSVRSICEDQLIDINQELVNKLEWQYQTELCPTPEDVTSIKIYFSESEMEALSLLSEVDIAQNSFDHILTNNIAGCYAISAIDQSGNESELTTSICVDNCPSYVLPNTFTPNNDNANDLFIPRQNRFIDRVEFKVFNRWGQKVFETSDPILNWDGTNLNRKELAEGTYYYTCLVFERRVSGISEGNPLNGTIQLIR